MINSLKRENGFLVPSEDILRSLDYHDDNKTMTCIYENDKYFIKKLRLVECLNELIAMNMGKLLDLKMLEYDLIRIYGETHVISKSFENDGNCDFGLEIMARYNLIYKKCVFDCWKLNNLQDIEDSLIYKYDIEKSKYLFKEVIKMFIFDLVILQSDRHLNNWYILDKDKKIEFGCIFDNALSFMPNYPYDGIKVNYQDYETNIYDEMIKFFQKYPKYFSLFLKYFNILTKDTLKEIIDKIENDIDLKILIKDKYLNIYNEHRNKIEKNLERRVLWI